ncbi:glutamine synthetase family protein [Sellimonas catena]|uniref:Glutamine synthetase n=1 Tax=Sellimonas catena TaxID=2994035 RepID=A0A9W6FDH0_9FIRM|nr:MULTISPECIES: glutamine synthetase family protein [Clostridia]GLG03670.1 glutamine synthetase [Sellimonas catena]GLG89543.1 glutamine synthetase [Sellimonas catena]HIV94239.1 glutamine synthetase family protein [Candidatus Sellimonas avistercoris]
MAKYETWEILQMIEEEDVKFIRLQFVDIFGTIRNIAVTAGQMEKALAGKCMVDGYSIAGMKELGYDRVYLKPDIDTFTILPWRPQQGKVARFLCDLMDQEGNDIAESPRYILRRVLKKAKQQGYSFDLDPECEFFLFETDEEGNPTTRTREKAGYLDVAPLDQGENARRDMILTLEEMGFEIESSHHEDAPAQHEVDFKQAQGVKVADQIVTFRSTVRTIAQRHGLHATFMPKPRTDLPGSALSLNISGFRDGKNMFADPQAENGLSQEAYSFIAGLLSHMNGMAAIANPIVNSYKRLKPGYHAPTELFWSLNDYRAPIRVVKGKEGDTHIEWTLPDGAANPYLLIAMVVASGLNGIQEKMIPLKADEKAGALPGTLKESLTALEKDEFLRNVCGESYVRTYLKEKTKEWELYTQEVTDWELKEYLHRF